MVFGPSSTDIVKVTSCIECIKSKITLIHGALQNEHCHILSHYSDILYYILFKFLKLIQQGL